MGRLVDKWQKIVNELADLITTLTKRKTQLEQLHSQAGNISDWISEATENAKSRAEKLSAYGLSPAFVESLWEPALDAPDPSGFCSAAAQAAAEAGTELETAKTDKSNADTNLSNAKRKEKEEEEAACGSLQ